MLGALQIVQVRVLRVITRAFKVTPKSALDIEFHVISIKQRLKRLTYNAMLRIAITFTYERIIEDRFKRRHRQMSSLKALSTLYERRFKLKIRNLKKVIPYVVLS